MIKDEMKNEVYNHIISEDILTKESRKDVIANNLHFFSKKRFATYIDSYNAMCLFYEGSEVREPNFSTFRGYLAGERTAPHDFLYVFALAHKVDMIDIMGMPKIKKR